MSDSLESFASDFNSAASHGLYNTIDVFIESMLYGFLTVATFFAVKLLRKQTTSRTRFLSSIIIIQWIVKTIASFGGLTWICLYYAKTRYVIENGELVRQVNPVIKGTRGMLNVADQLFWVLNEILALAVVIWRAYSLYPENRIARVLLSLMWTGYAGMTCLLLLFTAFSSVQFALAIKSFIWEHQGVITSETIHGSMTNVMTIVKSLLGLSTCLVATILVARRALQLRSMQRNLNKNSTSAKIHLVLYTIVEWGVLLSAVYIYRTIYLCVGASGINITAPFIAQMVGYYILLLVITAHPALTALVLSRRQSLVDTNTFGPSKTLETLRFASQRPNSENPRPEEVGESGQAHPKITKVTEP